MPASESRKPGRRLAIGNAAAEVVAVPRDEGVEAAKRKPAAKAAKWRRKVLEKHG
jgi:hypothetical protein